MWFGWKVGRYGVLPISREKGFIPRVRDWVDNFVALSAFGSTGTLALLVPSP